MSAKLVSVYVLLYKNVQELPETIDSILMQTYRPLEVVISDDCSGNYDTQLLDREAERLTEAGISVRINVNAENIGTVKHVNRVQNLLNGDIWIPVSTGDRLYEKDTIDKIVKAFAKQKTLLLTARRIDERGEGETKVNPKNFFGFCVKHFPKKMFDFTIQKRMVFSGCNTYYTKALFEKHGNFDEKFRLVEDYTYLAELMRKGERFGFLSEVTVRHGAGGVSTGKVNPLVLKDIETYRDGLYEIRNTLSKKTRRYIEADYQRRHITEN